MRPITLLLLILGLMAAVGCHSVGPLTPDAQAFDMVSLDAGIDVTNPQPDAVTPADDDSLAIDSLGEADAEITAVNPADLIEVSDVGPETALSGGCATSRQQIPHAPADSRPSRHIPRAIRRQVFERDGGRCTFVGEDGGRRGIGITAPPADPR